jgi:hypothetical protein
MAKGMNIGKSVVINRPANEIFEYLRFVKNQDEFSVWNMRDPEQKVSTQGTDGQPGFIYSWDSKDKSVGAGSQELINLVDGQKIEYELRFERPMKNTSQSFFTINPVSPVQTEVSWNFHGPSKFPMSLFKGIFQKMLGKDMSQSLQNLKEKLEG